MEVTELSIFVFSTVWFTWRARNPPQIPYQPYAPLKKDEFTVEVCLSDIESAQAAVRGGCTSLEVCSDRPQGGVTPSHGLVEELVARYKNTVEIHCLIRPRPGNFDYTDSEFDVMLRDVIRFKAMGVDGIVVGMLTRDSTCIDIPRMKVLREASRGMMLTFHRAFDVLRCSSDDDDDDDVDRNSNDNKTRQAIKDKKSMKNMHKKDKNIDNTTIDSLNRKDIKSINYHLSVIVDELECDRLLTSGQASSALEGKDTLMSVSYMLHDRKEIKVIAAAGISTKNVQELIVTTRVGGVHAGSAMCSKIYSALEGWEGHVHMGKKPAMSMEESWQHEPDGESWEIASQTKVGEFCSEISKALVARRKQKTNTR